MKQFNINECVSSCLDARTMKVDYEKFDKKKGPKKKNKEVKTVSIAVMGTTSIVALAASGSPAVAEGLYLGVSQGVASGQAPHDGAGSSDYTLNGPVTGLFVGFDRNFGNNGMFWGGEVAWSGQVDGDGKDNSSYEYSYDVIYTLDAKLRVGAALGNAFEVYGFAGVTTGNANAFNGKYGGYVFNGTNFGAGASMDVAGNAFVGVEYIMRNVSDYEGASGTHSNISLRAGFNF